MSLFQELGKHLENVKSWNPQQAKTEEVFSYIDLSSVDKDRKAVDLNQIQQLKSVDAPSRARQIVKKSDILVPTVRPNLNGVALVPDALDKATASTGYCVLRVNEKKLNAQYLFYWVQTKSFINEMVSKATGANYPAVSDKIIKQSKIPLPPLAEQQKIASILEAADCLRQKDQQLVERYTALSQSLFLEMFGDPFVGETFLLEKHVDIISGYAFKSADFVDEGIPLIKIGSVNKGYFDTDSFSFLPKVFLDKFEKWKVNEGDILMSLTGTVGKDDYGNVERATNCYESYLLNQRVAKLSPINQSYLSDFLFGMFANTKTKKELTKISRGVRQANISNRDIQQLKMIKPPMYEQKKYTEAINLINIQKKQAQRSLEKSEALFNSLLQRAFTGELTSKMAA